MLKQCLSAFALVFGVAAVGCSSTSNTPGDGTGTGAHAGSGGSSSGGSGGSGTGGATGGNGGGTSGDSGPCPKFDYTNYNPTMSPTLKNDIQPILTNSCALASSCHQAGSSHHPNMGPSMAQLDGGKPSDAVLMGIITELSKTSEEVAGRKVMVPMKPEDSYMMNKLDGTNTCSGFVCMGALGCGIQMPDPGMPLEKAQLELIRAWIKKGAPM